MSKELIVSGGRHETRLAILEDDQVVEVFHQREKEYSLAGSIHKGRVTRVLPGMQSAFVDIGLERDAFLYVSDFFEDSDEYEAVVSTVEDKVLKMTRTGNGRGEKPETANRADEVSTAASTTTTAETTAPSETAERLHSSSATREARGDRQEPIPDARESRGERQEPNREARESRGERQEPNREARESRGERQEPNREARESRGERQEPNREARESRGDRQESNRDFRDGRGDRRGRRGRRRGRNGRAAGFPESKFFSPRADAGSGEPPVVAPEIDEEFMVLPGESLAKYAVSDVREDEEAEESEQIENGASELSPEAGSNPIALAPTPDLEAEAEAMPSVIGIEPDDADRVSEQAQVAPSEDAPQAGPVAQAPETAEVEPALPAEHPLAALGDASSWTTSPLDGEPQPSAAKTDEQAGQRAKPQKTSDVAGIAVGEDSSAAEASQPASGQRPAEEGVAEEASVRDDETPEPARMPTSLTATLREQGHRYPHRVSRRMRRKLRGQQPTEDRQKPAGTPEVETKVAEVRDERRPEQRPDRAQKERDRTERLDRDRPVQPSIADLLKEGQEIIVQIAKEPLGQKGARITSHIALPGRFVVYMPTVDHVGVSRKIPSDEERQRLKRILQTHRQGIPGGFICRTAGEGKSEEEIKTDMHFLYNLWLDMRQKAEKRPAPALLHHDLDLVQRVLRDQLTSSFKTIWVDNEEIYESVLRFVQRFQPALVSRVKLYTRSTPIFDEFSVTSELEKALRPKVWLKSGGYIVINQTEALVAIDINTGKYVGKSNRLEDTIVKINTDAIKEIVRQIRLRDLGGIIVVDFIDMDERKNRQKVMQALEEGMRADRAPFKILQFNDFGLVAITRKRVKQSLERTLCSPCPYCEGAGYVKSVGTIITEIMQEAQRIQKMVEQENVVLRVNPEVAKVLKSNQNSYLQEIEQILERTVLVKSDPLLHQTKFDLA